MNREELKAQVDAELQKINPSAEPSAEEAVNPEAEVSSQVSEESSSDPYLEEAIKMGYNPEYNGLNKKSPEQFVKDGSFFRKIDALKKQIEEQSQAMKLIVEHNKKKEVEAYKQGLDEAMQKRREAVELGDVEKFNQAEVELQKLQKPSVEQAPSVPQAPELTPELKEFIESNKSWFNKNSPENERMVIEADGLFTLEKRYNPNMSDKEALDKVTSKIKALYPEKFENQNKQRPSAVSKSSVSSSKSVGSVTLSDRQRKVFEMAKAIDPSLKIEDYAKQLNEK